MKHVRSVAAASLILLVGGAALARADDKEKYDFGNQLAIASDSTAAFPDRDKALGNCMQGAHAYKGAPEQLSKAIPQILKELEKKRNDPKVEPACVTFVQTAFRGIDACPLLNQNDVGAIAKPYLAKDTDTMMRTAALLAIAGHGASGISADLLAIFNEGASKQHDAIEDRALNAVAALSGSDAEKTLREILKSTKSRATRTRAIGLLGELQTKRSASDLDNDATVKLLMDFAAPTFGDVEVACAAAIAIFHRGSYDGIGGLVERCRTERRGPPRECYRAICYVAHKLPAGFANVNPDQFLTSPQKSDACGEMYAWWDKVKGTKVDAGLFEALQAEGCGSCKDSSPSSKEAIGVLLAGLAVKNRALRYQAFDTLVKRLGPSDFSKDFKRLIQRNGPSTQEETEPAAGYPEGSNKSELLYELQKERAKKWRDWWDNNSGKATFSGGQWRVS